MATTFNDFDESLSSLVQRSHVFRQMCIDFFKCKKSCYPKETDDCSVVHLDPNSPSLYKCLKGEYFAGYLAKFAFKLCIQSNDPSMTLLYFLKLCVPLKSQYGSVWFLWLPNTK